MAQENSFDSALWDVIRTQMGWHLTHVPESYGGIGLGYVELCILLEKMGKYLLCAPFYSSVVLGVNALRICGQEEQQARLFAQLEEGATLSLAWSCNDRLWGLDAIRTQYKLQPDGSAVLKGTCNYVIDGHTADFLIVAARSADSTDDQNDFGLFIVQSDAANIARKWTPNLDQTRKLAEIQFKDVLISASDIMCADDETAESIECMLALAGIGLAAEQLGVADQTLTMTLDYISERKQFGRVVGSFQAMKHKAADMLVRAEATRSAVYYAACIADEYLNGQASNAELLEAASIAKSYSCEAAFINAGCALQMHGGIGFTWEQDVHLFFKRAKAAQVVLGDDAWHKARLADMILENKL